MSWRPLVESREIEKAQRKLISSLRSGVEVSVDAQLGFHGGHISKRLNWLSEGYWYVSGPHDYYRDNHWNAFGIQYPVENKLHSIVCELNIATHGASNRVGAIFLANSKNRFALASRGKIGGGKKGIGKSLFKERYSGAWIEVEVEGKLIQLVLLGYVDIPSIRKNIAKYVYGVLEIKKSIREEDMFELESDMILSSAAATGSNLGIRLGEREGLKILIKSWMVERSARSRALARKYHGSKCVVCGFDFGKAYGKIGKNFIEFHHLFPLSLGDRETDPAKDLVPLCSNCHSMVHRQRPIPYSLSELKKTCRIKY